MKLAIVSDFHLGYSRFEQDAFSQALEAFSKAVELGDAVILAGDLFDSKIPRPEVLSQAFRIFEKAKQKKWSAKKAEGTCELPVIAIHGTHERRGKEFVNPIQVLESAGFFNNAHNGKIVFDFESEKLAVQGVGGVPDDYAKTAFEKKEFKPIPNAFNVFVFHQTLSELIPVAKDALSVEDLPRGFNLYVCGHFHAHKKHEFEGAPLLIPGSTVVTQMKKEEEGAKGFYIYDTREKKAEFISIESRPFHYVEVQLNDAGLEHAEKQIVQAVERVLKESKTIPIVKVKVSGTLARGLDSGNLNAGDLERKFEGKAHVEIDKLIESSLLKEKIDALRNMREKKASVREMGLSVLKEKLKQANSGLNAEEAEELFDLLCEGHEQALKKLLKK